MNEELILKMAEPNVQNGVLTYSLFDRLYGVLSRREQYQVCEILNQHGIQLEDQFGLEDLTGPAELPEPEGPEDGLGPKGDAAPLLDEGLFKDRKGAGEYLYYFDEIKQSNDTLVRLAKEGSRQALQDLCVKNRNLVAKYANSYYRFFGNDLDIEDLMQAGFLGLVLATEKFDLKRDAAFSTYAVFCIKQAISRQVFDQGYRIRIPVHVMEKISRMTRLDNQYGLEGLDYRQRMERIAEEMGLSVAQVEELVEIKYQFLSGASLDTPVGEEEDTSLGELLPAEERYEVESQLMERALRYSLNEVLSTLSPREEQVLRLRFGLADGRPETLEEVGREFNVSRERIRQIEAKALRKLRHPARGDKTVDFLEP